MAYKLLNDFTFDNKNDQAGGSPFDFCVIQIFFNVYEIFRIGKKYQ